jgi:hypothetical protein
MALEGVPILHPGVGVEEMANGNRRVTMTIGRGPGFFEKLRPLQTRRSYELDEFGTFVIALVNGQRSVLDVVNAFEERFQMSRREVELSVVAFFKLLMQRNVVGVEVPDAPQTASKGAKTAALALLLVGLMVPVGLAQTVEGQETVDAIAEITQVAGGRMPGSAGNLALETRVAKRFEQSGFDHGEIVFSAPLLEPGSLSLSCGEAGTFTADAMHPTLMRPGNFSCASFDTRLVYLGNGDMADLARLKGVDLDGAIAVMAYGCGDKWMDFLRFDIGGFVFVGQGDYPHEQSVSKVFNSEVAVPRFYIDGDAGEQLRALAQDTPGHGAQARAVPSTWHKGDLRDLWVLIPGRDPELDEKLVVMTAALDANSVVPVRAQGAQRAINLHLLLSLLDEFKQQPPLHSVMLVAVNGHSQQYAGERELAWHLMTDETRVEAMRDQIAQEMRLARLHTTEYAKLTLKAPPAQDRADLHVMLEVLGRLDETQQDVRKLAYEEAMEARKRTIKVAKSEGTIVATLERLEMPELDEVLALSDFDEAKIAAAISDAREKMVKAYRGFFAKRGRDPEEVEQEKQEDMAHFDALSALSYDGFMEKAGRVKQVFDDEKLFEKWRSDIDKSSGRRIYVKTVLQDDFKGQVNRTMQDIILVSSTNMTTMAADVREARLVELASQRDNLRKVLVLFNKIDIGVGRSRTQYRQIAVNDVQRKLLRESVDHFVEMYGRWEGVFNAQLARDKASGSIRRAIGRRKVALALALELDAHADQVGFSYQSFRLGSGWFNGFAATCQEVADAVTPEGAARYVDALGGGSAHKPGHYFRFPASAITYFHAADKIPAFALKSAFADEGRLFGTDDSLPHLDAQRLHGLATWSTDFIMGLVDAEKLVDASTLKQPGCYFQTWSTLLRTYSLEQYSGKPIPTRPISNCLVMLNEAGHPPTISPSITAGDVINCTMGMSDETGNAYLYGLSGNRRMAPTAYQMDAEFREVLMTIDKGRVQSSKQINSNVQMSPRATLPMFECREFVVKDRRDPTGVSSKPSTIFQVWPKKANGQSDPEKYGVHGAASLSPTWSHVASGPIGIYLYRRRAELVQDALMIITDTKRCVLNATEAHPEGIGFPDQQALGGDILRRASADMALLNRSRNASMKGVVNQLLDDFMDRGDALNLKAEELKAAHDHVGYLSTIYEAFGNHVKAYGELAKMNEDMLKAVIAFMALMLPFCFFLQKLLFNFKKLEHELAGFSILFVCMFVLFRFIHPAFRMAMCPEAIFIAFVLGAIGVFTTGVLRSRFNEEMTILFRGMGGIGEEVGYGTVGTTAMLIGVQNMRRRRVRTGLTTATIVLVVFTMLAFSSVSRKAKPTLVPKSNSAPYTGLFYHWPGGVPIDGDTHKLIRELFADRAEVKVRRLLTHDDPMRLELVDDAETFLEILAVTGLPMDDGVLRDSMSLVEGEPFSSAHAAEIMLPMAAADALDLGADDIGRARIRLLGREWVLRGIIDDQRYKLARDLNPNLPLVPLETPPKSKRGDDSLDIEVADVTDKLIDTAALAIIPEGIAAELGAMPRSLSIAFRGEMDEAQLGTELQRVLAVTDAKFYVGSGAPFKLDEDTAVAIKPGVYYVGSSYRTAIGGLAKLLIPLIIAGSIILNTMLGTVYERKSEIAVFNAIGLNPTHIFMFFLAEATVYSFIGAVGGYLIGQILTISLKGAGLIQGVNINFSSLMVVYAVVFTMGLVILSTIYPGYVATRTAVPSGKRKWSMPDHDGQFMSLVFPFIYRPRLAYGVMFYLQQFFEPLADQSTGDLMATLEEIKSAEDEAGHPVLSLRYNVALAPYDLGVTQDVTFTTQYDEVVSSFRLHMAVDRISGRDTNWVTTNKPFLERMRKFLIRWRNIDPTRQTWFVKNAVSMFEAGVPPQSTASKE